MTDIKELTDRQTKLEDAFNSQCQEKAMCSAHVQTMSSVVTRLEHTVYGNGKEGLTTIAARTDEKLAGVIESVEKLPETIKQDIDEAIEKVLLKVDPPKEEKELSSTDKATRWFTDRILPYFVTGLFIIILQALWEMAKVKLNAP
jgi:hypothetical protein